MAPSISKAAPLVLVFAACTLINGSGFEECQTDLECGGSKVCVSRYCLPTPPDCRRAAGNFGVPNAIRLAALLPLSDVDGGVIDQSEVAGLNAIELAVEDVNTSGGVDGRPFSLTVCNTRGATETLAAQVSFVVGELKVPAFFTSGSDHTLLATEHPARMDAGTLVMSATATTEQLIGVYQRQGVPWRVAPPDSLQVRVMARVIADDPGLSQARTIALLYEDSSYGSGLASALRERLNAPASGKRAEIIDYPGRGKAGPKEVLALQTFHGALTATQRLTVFIGFPPDIRTVVNGTRTTATLSYSSGHRFLFSDSAKDPTIITPQTLPELSGSFGTAPAQGVGTAFDDFRSRYRRRFEIDPNDFAYTSHSYDAAFAVMYSAAWAAREQGSITGPRMIEGMSKLSSATGSPYRVRQDTWRNASSALLGGRAINLEGASGPLDFDLDAGAPSSPYEVWQVTDAGTLTTVRLVTP